MGFMILKSKRARQISFTLQFTSEKDRSSLENEEETMADSDSLRIHWRRFSIVKTNITFNMSEVNRYR